MGFAYFFAELMYEVVSLIRAYEQSCSKEWKAVFLCENGALLKARPITDLAPYTRVKVGVCGVYKLPESVIVHNGKL